jgi:hypothetical protein
MWACMKSCFSEHLAGLSAWTIAGIIEALIGIGVSSTFTGGATAGLFAAVASVVGPYVAGGALVVVTMAISALIGCLVACLTGVHP